MLKYVYGHDLAGLPKLADTMFRDRAAQFKERLGWDVTVDSFGHERDEYDGLDPLYVIWTRPDGRHGGSMRFLPTTGRTMVNEHFSHLAPGERIESPLIWECTRFCLAPDAGAEVSAALALGAGEVMAGFNLSHFVGVFDRPMTRIYGRLGLSPDIVATVGEGRHAIGLGFWEMQEAAWEPILRRVGVSRETSRRWFLQSLAGMAAEPGLAKAG